MKYLLFFIAVSGVMPAALLMTYYRSLRKFAVLLMIVPVLVFNQTAINFFSHETYRGTSRGMEISLIYLAAAALLISYAVQRGRLPDLLPDRGSRLYWLYFLLCLPSLGNAESVMFSMFEVWKMVMCFLVFLAVRQYLVNTGDDEVILSGLGAVVLIGFLPIVFQHFAGTFQTVGVFPHQNSLAMFMTLTGTLFFSRYFNGGSGWKSTAALLVFLVAAASLVRTYSRGALVCFPAGCLVTAAVSLRYGFSYRKIRLPVPIVLLGVVMTLIFLPKIIHRFETAPESSGQTRLNFAVAAMNMIKDKPFAGVGLNNWGIKINPPYEYSRHRDPLKGFTEDYKDGIVETVYLLAAAECGVVALLGLLLWFGYYWYLALKLAPVLRRTPYFYIPAGMLGGLTGAYMQSFLEWILKQQINFIQLMIFFAMLSFLSLKIKKAYGGVR